MTLSRWAILAARARLGGCTLPMPRASHRHHGHDHPRGSGARATEQPVRRACRRARLSSSRRRWRALRGATSPSRCAAAAVRQGGRGRRRSRPRGSGPRRMPSGAMRNDCGGVVDAVADRDPLARVDDRWPGGSRPVARTRPRSPPCRRTRRRAPRLAGRPGRPYANLTSSGDSVRHGGHQLAKKLRSTQRPRKRGQRRDAAGQIATRDRRGAACRCRKLEAVCVAAGRLASTATSTSAPRPTPHAAHRASFGLTAPGTHETCSGTDRSRDRVLGTAPVAEGHLCWRAVRRLGGLTGTRRCGPVARRLGVGGSARRRAPPRRP